MELVGNEETHDGCRMLPAKSPASTADFALFFAYKCRGAAVDVGTGFLPPFGGGGGAAVGRGTGLACDGSAEPAAFGSASTSTAEVPVCAPAAWVAVPTAGSAVAVAWVAVSVGSTDSAVGGGLAVTGAPAAGARILAATIPATPATAAIVAKIVTAIQRRRRFVEAKPGWFEDQLPSVPARRSPRRTVGSFGRQFA